MMTIDLNQRQFFFFFLPATRQIYQCSRTAQLYSALCHLLPHLPLCLIQCLQSWFAITMTNTISISSAKCLSTVMRFLSAVNLNRIFLCTLTPEYLKENIRNMLHHISMVYTIAVSKKVISIVFSNPKSKYTQVRYN